MPYGCFRCGKEERSELYCFEIKCKQKKAATILKQAGGTEEKVFVIVKHVVAAAAMYDAQKFEKEHKQN